MSAKPQIELTDRNPYVSHFTIYLQIKEAMVQAKKGKLR